MKIQSYREPKSGFLSMEKDLGIITGLMLKNQRLKKLLYYTTPDALSKAPLTDDQSYGLFGRNIKIVPKFTVDKSVLNYIVVSFDNYSTNASNPEFRDNLITFDIVCHFDQWQLKDFELRPYRIAAEIDAMIDKQHLTGIGKIHFLGCNQLVFNNEFAGITLMYSTIHGGEDSKHMPNPADEEQYVKEFNELFNS